MKPVFRANESPFQHVYAIRVALLKLSMAGYRVVQFSAARELRIQIDRPYQDEKSNPVRHGDRLIESCFVCGCRVYWQVPAESKE